METGHGPSKKKPFYLISSESVRRPGKSFGTPRLTTWLSLAIYGHTLIVLNPVTWVWLKHNLYCAALTLQS